MLWIDVCPTIEDLLRKYPQPLLIVIQVGSNDIGVTKTVELNADIKRDLLRLKLLIPNTILIWSEILMRRTWHCAKLGKSLEASRKRVNTAITNFINAEDHYCIKNPNIRATEKDLYRYDGTHLSDMGNFEQSPR